jgi:hypothetical protein
MVTAQNTFNWLDSTSSVEEVACAQLIRHTLHNQDTIFTLHSEPALSGLWAALLRYSKPPPAHEAPLATKS